MSPIRNRLDTPYLDRGGVLDAVRAVLGRLPDEQREVVVLLGYYRLSRDEIGALLGQPVGRIDALFRAAVRRLRALLGRPERSLA
jgi:RNA polymerase sigma-70 factor (ECF subfamily)